MKLKQIFEEDSNKVKMLHVSPKEFLNVINKVSKNDLAPQDIEAGLDTLTIYDLNDYRKCKCYLNKTTPGGFAIDKDSKDLISFFSNGGPDGKTLVKEALKKGAKKTDCYALISGKKLSGDLYELYINNGFMINTDINIGAEEEAYSVKNGISRYVDDKGKIKPNDKRVIVFLVKK